MTEMTVNPNMHSRPGSTWWRWPLVPFASALAFGAALVAASILTWLSMKFSGFGFDGWMVKYVAPMYVGGAAGYAYTWAAIETAPQGKVIVAAVMTTLLAVIFVGVTVFAWISNYALSEAIRGTLSSMGIVVGAVASAITAKDR